MRTFGRPSAEVCVQVRRRRPDGPQCWVASSAVPRLTPSRVPSPRCT